MFSDDNFLKEFKNRNQTVLTLVYRNYAPKLATFLFKGFRFKSKEKECCFQGYKNNCDLVNAIQNTFEKAFSAKAIESYDGIRPYENYLFTIARNLTIDEFRKKKIRIDESFNVEKIDSVCSNINAEIKKNPENNVLINELRELITKFVETIDSSEREIIKYRFEGGLSQEESALILNLTRRKVRTLEKNIRLKALAFFKNTGYLSNVKKSGINFLFLIFFKMT